MEIMGKFELEFNSDYNHYRGSVVKIECVRYDVLKRIVDAVTPILNDEMEAIKSYREKVNKK